MFSILLFALCSAPKVSNSREEAALRQIQRRAADHLADALAQVTDRKARLGLMVEVADSYEGLDDGKALQILREAWSISRKHPGTDLDKQSSIALRVAGIAPAEGLKLLSQIRNKRAREQAAADLLGALSYRYPKLAVKYYRGLDIPNSDDPDPLLLFQ
jgi:hypothetical protein